MGLRLSHEQCECIRQHGARDYPSECCGVLLGKADGAVKQVREVVVLKNLRRDPGRAQELLPLDDSSREAGRNRFLIDPLEQLRVEKDARARGLDVVGYYHSHPDHPARPSNYDRELAWPRYSYVIISIQRGAPKDLTSWVLTEDRTVFCAEPVEIVT
jgi:proteasome lid subunit RPN8/RPN11